MKKALEVLNQLERDGVIARYAIGGAVAAIFYMEPFVTEDLDVFVLLPASSGSLLTVGPIYDALRARGYREDRECMDVEGVAVQFLPAYNALIEEALHEAATVDYEGTPTRVLRAEHLAAIMLDTARAKDRQRFAAFCEQAPLDNERLQDILERHGLLERWRTWTT
jgi:hypothetical protein